MSAMYGTITKPRRPVRERLRGLDLAGRSTLLWRRWRRPALYLAGFGFLDAAAFEVHNVIGLLACGATMFILEALSDGRRST